MQLDHDEGSQKSHKISPEGRALRISPEQSLHVKGEMPKSLSRNRISLGQIDNDYDTRRLDSGVGGRGYQSGLSYHRR